MNKNNFFSYFRKGTLGYRIFLLTLIFAILFVSIFSPFMLVEGSNRTLGFILLGILAFIYVFILLIYIWDYLKNKCSQDKESKDKK